MARFTPTASAPKQSAVGCFLGILFLTATVTSASDPPAEAASDPNVLRTQVEAVERRFNQAARERDRQSFRELLAKDSVFLAGELHRGRLGVLAIWQHLFDGKYDFRYDAEALDTTVARSGEFAWSVGAVRTSFQRPGVATEEVTDSHYLHLWTRGEEGAWQLAYASSLVVHPSLGAARDPRSGLMTAWPELADQIGARTEIRWNSDVLVRAESGELAYSFGEYEASFAPPGTDDAEPAGDASAIIAGKGHFLAVWEKDDKGHWQLAAEGFTPPSIYDE